MNLNRVQRSPPEVSGLSPGGLGQCWGSLGAQSRVQDAGRGSHQQAALETSSCASPSTAASSPGLLCFPAHSSCILILQ